MILLYVFNPRFHAAAIIILIAKSTGRKSAHAFASKRIIRNIPFAPPIIIATGPLKLSNQPGIGSLIVDVTISKEITIFFIIKFFLSAFFHILSYCFQFFYIYLLTAEKLH